MRGATVAVLDVKDLESGDARGVEVYKCDVGDREQVAKVAVEIERDVCSPSLVLCLILILIGFAARHPNNPNQQRRNCKRQKPSRPLA